MRSRQVWAIQALQFLSHPTPCRHRDVPTAVSTGGITCPIRRSSNCWNSRRVPDRWRTERCWLACGHFGNQILKSGVVCIIRNQIAEEVVSKGIRGTQFRVGSARMAEGLASDTARVTRNDEWRMRNGHGWWLLHWALALRRSFVTRFRN